MYRVSYELSRKVGRMPNITQEERDLYDTWIEHCPDILHKGHLEYIICRLMMVFMDGRMWRYSVLHACWGAVIHAAGEFKRKKLDRYEDKKEEETGTVFDPFVR